MPLSALKKPETDEDRLLPYLTANANRFLFRCENPVQTFYLNQEQRDPWVPCLSWLRRRDYSEQLFGCYVPAGFTANAAQCQTLLWSHLVEPYGSHQHVDSRS